jgi:hypothetical protein
MISCGIWPDGKKLVAVVLDDAGRARKPILVSRTERAAEALAIYLDEDLAADIVLVDACLKEPIGRAFVRSERVWVAPAAVVEPIRRAAALAPRAAAAMLARLPRIPMLRSQLRRPARDPRQLTLL